MSLKQDELEYIFLFLFCSLVETELYTCMLLVMLMVGNIPCPLCFKRQAPHYKMLDYILNNSP